MSHVDNVLLGHDLFEPPEIQALLLEPLPFDKRRQRFGTLTHDDALAFWGGSKYPECALYGAAFNYLDWTAFMAWLRGIPWQVPECVQVIALFQWSRTFEMFGLGEDPLLLDGEHAIGRRG